MPTPPPVDADLVNQKARVEQNNNQIVAMAVKLHHKPAPKPRPKKYQKTAKMIAKQAEKAARNARTTTYDSRGTRLTKLTFDVVTRKHEVAIVHKVKTGGSLGPLINKLPIELFLHVCSVSSSPASPNIYPQA